MSGIAIENSNAKLFYDIGEPFAAGLFEDEERSLFYRFSKAIRRYFENRPVNQYAGRRLYPSGPANRGDYQVLPDFSKTFSTGLGKRVLIDNYDVLGQKNPKAAQLMEEVRKVSNFTVEPMHDYYTMDGYTHSIPHFERILEEGLDSYKDRIASIQDIDMKDGLFEVQAGFENYHRRCLEHLESVAASEELLAALRQVPFRPARTVYEAIVGWNFIMYLEGIDNYGWIDHGLSPYHKGEDITAEIRELFENGDANSAWSCTIGPFYNDLTKQALVAIRGLRRPMLELRTTRDMPRDIWELALEALRSGSSSPSFYNEENIQEMLKNRYPEFSAQEIIRFSGAGCTEPNLAGLTAR